MPLRVLIAEDDADSAESLARLMLMWGHQARVARNGPEALTVASEYRPTIALVDIRMPGMDGYQVARRLREEQKGIILVALTGMTGPEHVQRCEDAGFVVQLIKPVDLERLRAMLGGEAATQEPQGLPV
jgi:two-component system CheB/CheR fusion protein